MRACVYITNNKAITCQSYTSFTFLSYFAACSLIKCYTVYTGTPRPWKITNDDCSVRGKQMVSINSKQELTELKHLLRSLFIKNVDDGRIVFSTYNVDPNYFVHIGNYLYLETNII